MERYYIGQSAQAAKTISESDIYLFAGITGDMNPVHVNQQYASQTRFEGRIAHGILSAGLISAVLGMQLPGPGSVYLGQQLKFLRPVYPGDTVTARATITHIDREKNRAVLSTVCTNQRGEEVVAGEATMLLPREENE
ncbi:MAG: MaoC family dehydratase [Oscillospiraceae bacterium]|nr:MaoC family dehydratase [Oscillospiraceae bacterium]